MTKKDYIKFAEMMKRLRKGSVYINDRAVIRAIAIDGKRTQARESGPSSKEGNYMTWNIWTVSPFTGDRKDCIASYTNRGQALARIKGLRRAAWLASSEMIYSLERG